VFSDSFFLKLFAASEPLNLVGFFVVVIYLVGVHPLGTDLDLLILFIPEFGKPIGSPEKIERAGIVLLP
jgi:hypothetical protein